MSLSDPSDDESSSDESSVPAKRPRADTYGASSTTSQGSILQESDDEPADEPRTATGTTKPNSSNKSLSYIEQSPHNDIRLSRSSVSENCSSPSDHYDDYRTSFDEEPEDGSGRASFQDNDNVTKKSNSSNVSPNSKGGFSDKIKHMMSNMGYKSGKGLGKFEHGRTEPVEASTQKGRRGLGLKSSTVGTVPRNFKWSPDDAKPEAKEKVLWMPPGAEPLSGDLLEEWLRKGPKKLTIEDETEFVDPQILAGVLNAKTIFDTLDDEDLRNARFRSNPYETIGSVIFLNRAAVKMANIDALFDFMFTEPKTQTGKPALEKELLYFADVCAGPGGFSEYVLYRKGWKAKGFGFTLKGGNDFKLSDFHAGTPETFNPYYGVENDGNIFNPENLTALKDYVLKQTDDKGVHFLMADGGFSVEGQENIQEILSKQLYLCQCLAALMLVRTGGHFVVKLFDVFTPFSVGLIYIMYRCFDKVCIHKPVTSRPANSERYLICLWKRLGTQSAEHHLYTVNSILWEGRDRGDDDVAELVPLSILQEDTGFYEYMYKSNCLIGERQIKNLLKIAEFSKNKELKETTQAEIREDCLRLWKLPDKLRTQTERLGPEETLTSILALMKKRPKEAHSSHAFKSAVLNKPPHLLEESSDLDTFKNVYDWHFYFLSNGKNSPDLKFFIGCGGKQVHQLEGTGWKSVVDLHLTLPAKTLLYGEIVKEFRGLGNNQMFSKALHVIDALMLGGTDISHLPLSERIHQCGLFCAALDKPYDKSNALPIKCKRLFNMEDFPAVVNNLECRAMKRVRRALTMDIPDRITNMEMFHVVGSVLFLKEIREPWQAHISKKCGRKYYFGIGKDKKPLSLFHIVEEAGLDLVEAYTQRVMWNWEEAACAIFEGLPHRGLTRAQLEGFIEHKTKR
ncbi:cap-specific mRNA (nucleoside-2'-O-)-methyltransferase 1 [Cydia splendana]|uniref:cap-specific mRNA (nucleoside-2'-O-)-methyltransferase 1 n=1 Tax=Cydia splendana TaxID=1100963 RepID=UPI00213FC63C